MSAIALDGNTLGCALGTGSFGGLGTAFMQAKKSTGELKNSLGALKQKVDLATLSVRTESSQDLGKKAETRENCKKSALTLAYEKLETFISDVGSVDEKAANKINQKKADFYTKYSYLKPDSEKSFKERAKDFGKNIWDGLCNIGSAIKDFVIDVGEWCVEHWKEILIGLACIVIGAVLTALTGGAFLAALAAGLKAALIAGLLSGGMNVAFYVGVALLRGEQLDFSDAMKKFGDGLASGFMFGGIFSGVSMAIGSGMRFAVAKSPQLAQKLLSNGKISEFLLKRMVPAGAKNSFVPSSRIAEGYKYDIQISKIFGNSTKFQLKWHSPDLMWSTVPSNSGAGWTAQIKIGNKFLTTLGTMVRNNKQNIVHIPIIRWPWR